MLVSSPELVKCEKKREIPKTLVKTPRNKLRFKTR